MDLTDVTREQLLAELAALRNKVTVLEKAQPGFSQASPVYSLDMLSGGGEMGALMRSMDWSATPLGTPDTWPQSLRTAVSICLNSRFPILIWWGPELVMVYNDAYKPMLGSVKHPRAMGQRGRECWPEIWDIIGPMLEGVVSKGEATWSDDQYLPLERNGYAEECYFTFSYSPIRDESGGIAGVFTAVTETTQRVLSERRLRTLRELATATAEIKTVEEVCRLSLEVLGRNPADLPFTILYLLDQDGKTARLCGKTGLPKDTKVAPTVVELEEISGTCIWPLDSVVASGQTQIVTNLHTLLREFSESDVANLPQTALVLPVSRPGQQKQAGFLVAGVSPRRELDYDYRGFFELVAGHLASAVSSARAYQEARERAEMLAELDRAKTQFFSNVSHEFRTPLTLLLGPLEETLAEGSSSLPPHLYERLDMARRNALRLLRLVNTLLDFSRIEGSRLKALYRPTNLSEFTAELASVFRSAIERAGLALVVDCPPLPDPVYIDREMWEKIIFNLLSNAFKFTLTGEICLKLRQEGDQVVLKVSDTGTGIPSQDLPRIFERFYRAHSDRLVRTYEGTGIGLALVQELVNMHQGTIEVESEVDRGTTFTITLPLGTTHLPEDRIEATSSQTQTGSGALFVEEMLHWLSGEEAPSFPGNGTPSERPEPETGFAGTRSNALVLLADDNADMRDYLQRLLSSRWQVAAVGDGNAALRVARERKPDLILSDVMMPGLDGFSLLKELRADPETSRIPVILLSARAGEEAAVEGLEAGADDYLIKPFSARELIARVQTNLELAQARQEALKIEKRRTAQLQDLAQTSLAINSVLAINEVLELITQHARRIIGSHLAVTSLTMNKRWQQSVNIRSLSEKYAAWRDFDAASTGEGIYRLVCLHNKPMRLTQVELEAHPGWRGFGEYAGKHPPLRGWLAVPLIGRDGANLGLIQLSDKYEGDFTEQDEAILVQLAQLASVAIDNAHLYELKDQFLSIASHELRTPITSIKGYSQILQRSLGRWLYSQESGEAGFKPDLEKLMRMQNSVLHQANLMNDLIDEMLNVSRIQSGHFKLKISPKVNIVSLIERVLEQQQDTTGDHRILFKAAHPHLYSNVDEARLEQVLNNLLNNAAKYSPPGEPIEVGVSLHQPENSGGNRWQILVWVKDRGTGISEEDQAHIFERFYRARASQNQNVDGLGLGLYISNEIIYNHGGRIWLESKVNEGSTFYFTLPLAKDEVAETEGKEV